MKERDIHVFNYGRSERSPNTVGVTIYGTDLYFSYRTIIAFQAGGNPLVCSENLWGQTTGRHLSMINPDAASRIDRAEFLQLLHKALANITQ